MPLTSIAQQKGLDERINDWFHPITESWESIVLWEIPESNIPLVLLLLIVGAVFFTLYFGFINLRKIPLAIDVVIGKHDKVESSEDYDIEKTASYTVAENLPDTLQNESQKGQVSHFQALTTAVSGTVGLGNIAGVALAIAIGGPGATFWMIVCGLLSMSTKFVECTLGVKYRDVDADGTVHGGPMYYLSKGLKDMGLVRLGKVLAVLFALFCVGASFGGGNAFQANQAAEQLIGVFGWEGGAIGFILGLVFAVIVGLIVIGGIKRIAAVTEKIVPFMAIIYALACIVVIAANIGYIDDAFVLIFEQAFTPQAGLGGLLGVLIVGFRRAVFSNEAGGGSAAIAHSAVKTKYPASEGIVALLEPFIDTVVICTLTALVIIFYNSGGIFEYGGDGAGHVVVNGDIVGGVSLTSMAFTSVIPWFPYVLTLAVVLFALSTMISWSYYGLQAWKFLFGRSKVADLTYKVLFLTFTVIGASVSLGAVFAFSDAMVLALVFPNMIGLLLLFPRVKEELKRYLKAIKQ